MGSPALGEKGIFGFALQTDKGSAVTPDNWLPLYERESVSYNPNYTILEWADGKGYQSQYVQAGKWAAGEVVVPAIPGYTADLITWLMTRDSYQQATWATVTLDAGYDQYDRPYGVKYLTDCKITRCRIDWRTGDTPTLFRLTLAALLCEQGSDPSPTMPTTDPYMFDKCTVTLETAGGGLASEVNLKAISVDIDNMVEDPSTGLRLTTSLWPQQLYNRARHRVTGTFDRDFVDSLVYADFFAGTESSVAIVDTVGVNTVTYTMARTLYTAHPMAVPGRHDEIIMEDGVAFTCLGSTDGATAPLTIA